MAQPPVAGYEATARGPGCMIVGTLFSALKGRKIHAVSPVLFTAVVPAHWMHRISRFVRRLTPEREDVQTLSDEHTVQHDMMLANWFTNPAVCGCSKYSTSLKDQNRAYDLGDIPLSL